MGKTHPYTHGNTGNEAVVPYCQSNAVSALRPALGFVLSPQTGAVLPHNPGEPRIQSGYAVHDKGKRNEKQTLTGMHRRAKRAIIGTLVLRHGGDVTASIRGRT